MAVLPWMTNTGANGEKNCGLSSSMKSEQEEEELAKEMVTGQLVRQDDNQSRWSLQSHVKKWTKQREKYNVSNTAYRPITKTLEKLTLKSESESFSVLSNSLQPHGL